MVRVRFFSPAFWLLPALPLLAQQNGRISGTVLLDATGQPLHHATILLLPVGRSVESNDEGKFAFEDLPPGRYELVAHMHALADDRRAVVVTGGANAEVSFRLRLGAVREELTVTASGRQETALEAFQSVNSLDSLELATRPGTSVGDVLEFEPGIGKRSYGPGTTRPVIRGFDGDRVLMMQDGLPTGTLSSQSGDHGEPIDPNTLERIEVLRGPATLLYGSNAIGGVVNSVTGHHQYHQHAHQGARGYGTGMGGSNNGRAGGAAGIELGFGNWLFHADGGGQRTGDYRSPLERIFNSATRMNNVSGGAAYYGNRAFLSGSYGIFDGNYGIPSPHEHDDHDGRGGKSRRLSKEGHHGHEDVALDVRRQYVRFNSGIREVGSLDLFHLNVSYSDWRHQEVADGAVESRFFNKQAVYRGVFDQRRRGRLDGSFGFQGLHRHYKTLGEEALAPPVRQDGLAGFALEQVRFERFRLQLGGRLESNWYRPDGLRKRNFTGFSGAAGISVPLWAGGVLVANYSHSTRAPALEELYNRGPHAGNLTYEIGNPNLKLERGNGVDVSFRQQSNRWRAEGNWFYYGMRNFVYLAPTGAIEDGLPEAIYSQGNSRYTGAEGRLSVAPHPSLWLHVGADAVNARLTEPGTPLPRITPVRGKVGADWRYRSFLVSPEWILADRQDRVFTNETETAGFGLMNVRAGYTRTTQHFMHTVSLNWFNALNRLYRNHLSFIKDFAPEIGRGVLVSYTIRFF